MTSTGRDPASGLPALLAVLGWLGSRSAAHREEFASRDPVGSRR